MTGFPMASWFSYGRFSVGGGGFWKGKITPKLRSTTHPAAFISVVRFVSFRILVEKVRSFLYFVFNCIEYGTSLLRERLT